ncbi:hypothetical protein AAIH18_22590, partial [Pantoea agglomerans]
MTVSIAAIAATALIVLAYPSTSQWLWSYQQTLRVGTYADSVEEVSPDAATQLRQARRYNDALTAGVDLLAGSNVPTGVGQTSLALEYEQLLRADPDGLMARLRFDAAEIDLP